MSTTNSKAHGWKGKLLRIDLGSGNTSIEEIDESSLVEHVGGRGLASKILVDEVDPVVEPLSPANKVILSVGPLVGTTAPGASRTHVVSKSPLTNLVSCLNAGGHFGASLKSAGYDVVVLEGRSAKPVYVRIDGDLVELRDARELWGKPVTEAQGTIQAAAAEPRQARVPRPRHLTTRAMQGERAEVLCIGPAGERQDRIASVVGSEHWSVGGAGLGAVLGSKNVKAVAVSGSSPTTVASAIGLSKAVARAMRSLRENYVYYRRLAAYGTGAFVRIVESHGALPTLNFRGGVFDAVGSITGEAVADRILESSTACFGCPIACGRLTTANGSTGAGPEYEHLVGFGSNCGVGDLFVISVAARACRENGFDAVSAAAAVAEALELGEAGLLADVDVAQVLKLGDGGSVIELVEQMVAGRGLGTSLRQGPQALAEKFGHPEVFVGLKGQALSACDPRGDEAMALSYATAGDALARLPDALLLGRNRQIDVVDEAIGLQDFATAVDSAGLCPLIAAAYTLEDVASLLSATTGRDYSAARLSHAGAATWRMERSFGRHAGVVDDDALPPRLAEPLNEGPATGRRPRTNELLPAYYQTRGWDSYRSCSRGS